eukprot:12556919-Alexandrium_andersonii.AAC.1
MSASLVGSEMCIRDSSLGVLVAPEVLARASAALPPPAWLAKGIPSSWTCLLYTSDAADDM